MADSLSFDVVVVGAGIAGSALACSLAGHGMRIALVEARSLPAAPGLPASGLAGFDPRVSALTPRSVAHLRALGAWEAIEAYRCQPYRHMTVWDAEGTGSIDFDCSDVGAAALGTIVENRAITAALAEQLAGAAELAVFAPQTVQHVVREGARVQLHLADGRQLHAALIVGADGALSPLREALGFRTREWDYGHRAIVTTVQTELPHAATAWQRFLPTGPLALLPLPADGQTNYCSLVWSVEDAAAEQLMALATEDFCAALTDASEQRLGRALHCAERLAFPLRQRHAVDYIEPGVALVADAAHTIHPLAGQGINLGLDDVAVLANELTAAHGRGLDIGDMKVLRRYQRQRKGSNLLMMAAMDGFVHLFGGRALPLRWLRNTGLRGVDAAAPLKRTIMRHAMGLGD